MGCCWGRPYQVPFVTAGGTAADFFYPQPLRLLRPSALHVLVAGLT
jgi:hypothetical protein